MTVDVNQLIEEAKKGRENAYTPYSKFKVGAAILMDDGSYVRGCNVENSSFGLCNCAERTAMFKMVSEGYKKEQVVAMAIIADTEGPCSPCGACRQVMSELLPQSTRIFMANLKGDIEETTIDHLLPYAFTGDDI